jgi:HlyD family secretion protein
LKPRNVVLLFVVLFAALGFWLYSRKNGPRVVPFTRVKRETLISALPTNGKVEPLQFAAVRVDLPGLVNKLPVQAGQRVAKGAVLAELNVPDLQAQLAAAQARLEQARADLANIERGGRKADLAEIQTTLDHAKLDRDAAHREYSALRRLEEKQAATREEVANALGKLRQAELDIEGLERKRAALVTSADRSAAQARLQEAEAAVQLARRRVADSIVHSPISGVIYNLPIRLGTYLNTGDLVANVGVLDTLRVRVYVDEPELGRVAKGLPVTITWDALPGKQWQGKVERLPTEIQPLGTRQVGEVWCTIDNPGHELVPGTNVNAEIRSAVVPDALTIPKEALRRGPNGSGVLILADKTVQWRAIKTGVSSISRVQIVQGLAEGDPVALPTDFAMRDGMEVTPTYP